MKKYQILGSVLIILICLESMFRVGYSIYPAVIILLELIVLIVVAFEDSEVSTLKKVIVDLSNGRNSLSAQNDTIKEMYETALLDLCKAKSETDAIRQKYSRTNQPRSGGKFTPRLVNAGDKYLCIKDVRMTDYIAFTKDVYYISEHDGCITNNKDNESHAIGSAFCKKHFKLIAP